MNENEYSPKDGEFVVALAKLAELQARADAAVGSP
jgi:hypothetical protein